MNWKYNTDDIVKWHYFTMKEMTKSSTAEKLGFINKPLQSDIDNLDELVTKVLDPLREAWGKPIRVTSGYRCVRLNKAVGGVQNSQHTKGQAADLQPIKYSEIEQFISFVRDWCTHNEFDQCIIETSKTGKWIHISYAKGKNRKKLFSLSV